MTAVGPRVEALERGHPEWKPWLTVLTMLLGEIANPAWDAVVPARQRKVPLLADAVIHLDRRLVRCLWDGLVGAACRSGTVELATLEPTLHRDIDLLALFSAALCQDAERLEVCGADPGAVKAIAALVPVPFLHACNRRWAGVRSASSSEGYCPICGAWPTLAEVRGIERSRYLRCGRCGSAWQAACLSCPYCGMTDHAQLASLVPEKGGTAGVIEACKRCLGYVKTLATLQGSAPAQVLIDDLATVALDVVAFEHGYRRPDRGGHPLAVSVTDGWSQ